MLVQKIKLRVAIYIIDQDSSLKAWKDVGPNW